LVVTKFHLIHPWGKDFHHGAHLAAL